MLKIKNLQGANMDIDLISKKTAGIKPGVPGMKRNIQKNTDVQ